MINYRSYSDMAGLIHANLPLISSMEFDLIVGIPRSGIIPAHMIALDLNISICSLDDLIADKELKSYSTRKTREAKIKRPSEAKKILIVEDSYNTGRRIPEHRRALGSALLSKVTFMAVYSAVENPDIDIYLELVPQPRVFEWNIFHHEATLSQSCFDMDGVLCEDPVESDNDDGPRYIAFMKSAKPKYIPIYKIKTIVTSRLEKYRPYTEKWLKDHGVEYENLLMLDGYTAEERRKQSLHAPFKANHFTEEHYSIFFESNYDQAVKIAELTGKQVYCVDENVMLYPEAKTLVLEAGSEGSLKEVIKNKAPGVYGVLRRIYRSLR